MALALPVIATTGASKRDEAMNNLFDTLDTDNSNTLDVEEFKKLGLVMMRSMGRKMRLQDMSSQDAKREMMRATSDSESTTLSREDWIKFAQRGLSNLNDETFFKKMQVYTADAVRIIEEEQVRQERRAARKVKKKKSHHHHHKKKRSMRHQHEEASVTETTPKKSTTPRVKSPPPRVKSPPPRELIEVNPKVSQSSMQDASVSPISATVSSARVEQHAVAVAEDSPRPKYPRKRTSAAPPPHEAHVPTELVTRESSAHVAKPAPNVIKSMSKKNKDGVAVGRDDGSRMKLDSGKLHNKEFHEATVLVTSLRHLHRSATKKNVDAAPAKKEEHAKKSHVAPARHREALLSRASKAW